MTDNRTTELLPCPFCGGEALPIYGGKRIMCLDCSLNTKLYKTADEAIAAWNTRVERTCKRVWLEDWLWRCSECGSQHDTAHLYNYCPNCGAKVVDE